MIDDALPEGHEPPPRGVRTMAFVRWALFVFAAAVASFVWFSYGQEQLGAGQAAHQGAHPKYRCPMHPQIVSTEAGECPICHMDLEPIAADRAAGAAADAGIVVTYTCPMHPDVHASAPGRCPNCKMPLEPVSANTDVAPGAVPPGTVPIKLALDRIQSIGVRTSLVEDKESSGVLRVTAVVTPPEQGAAEVHVRTPGFVEAILVDQTGIGVGTGQPLLSLFSPELLQAQNEFLATRKWTGDAGVESAARRKLDLLGMTPADIDRVVTKGEPIKAITIAAPRGGYVTKKNVVLGSYVTPEMTLYEIQDLSRVYVVADVFLRDVPHVTVGTEGRFVPAGDANRSTPAKVDLIYPLINTEARTRRVRMQIKTEAGTRHAPGEYGVVELATGKRRAIIVPRDALVDTGTAQYVFVVEPEGRFIPRAVTIGASDGDHVIVDAGLRGGERVVSSSTFLIDSESRLQASVSQPAPAPTSSERPVH